MADTLALYERILGLVKPAELHRSCNGVLQDEYSALQGAVDEILAAFAKVEEVRDAVNQLEQGKPPTGRTASLMEAMDAAMQLRRGLKEKLEEVAAGMQVQEVASADDEKKEKKKEKSREKRKRLEKEKERQEPEKEESSSSSSSSSSEEEQEVRLKDKKKSKRTKLEGKKETASGDDGKMSGDLAMAHDALKAISTVRTVNRRIQFDMVNQWAEALFDLKRVLKRQASCDASSTDKPVAEVAARAMEAAAAIFQKLEWMDERVKEVRSVIAALTDACSKNEQLRIYFHRVRAQLESLEMSIPSPAAEHTESSGKSASQSVEEGLRSYRTLSSKIQKVSGGEKPSLIFEALGAIQQVMADDTNCARREELRGSVESACRWIREVPLGNDLTQEYLRFADSVRDYSKRLGNQVGWQRLVISIMDLLAAKSKPSKASQSPRISKTAMAKQELVKSLLDQVEQWQDGIFSLDQIDKLMKELNSVVSYNSMDWKPVADPTVRTCVWKLKSCIQQIKKPAHRDKRLKTVNKWKASIDKHQR